VVFWPRGAASAESGPLLPDLKPEDVVALTIEDGEGMRTQLLRQDDGWILADTGDFPADGDKVEPILAKIAAMRSNRLVTRSSDSHKRLQVAADDFARRIELEMRDGTSRTLFIGSAPNPSGTHVRRADQNATYLTGEIASWEVNAAKSGWINASYVSLNQDEITAITLQNDGGTVALEKGTDGEWALQDLADGELVEQTQVNSLISRISNVRMTEPLGTVSKPEYGLDDPQVEVTIFTEDSEDESTRMYTLLVGAKDPDDDNYFMKWSDSDYYVKVAAFNADNLLTWVRQDFIQEPPTPEPTATPGEETATPTPET
jgi:hypothetical protein